MGWAIAVRFQLLRQVDTLWPVYLVLSSLILAVFLVLTGGVFRKKEGVE